MCNYYPDSVILNNFGSIQWNWTKKAVCNFLLRFFCWLMDIQLHSVGYICTGYTSIVLTCCVSSPVLSSVFVNFDIDLDLANLVISVLTSQHPKIAQPILKKFGVLKSDAKVFRMCDVVVDILCSHDSLYELHLEGELPSDSDLLSSIIATVHNPNFCKLSLARAGLSLKLITN